MSKKSIWPIVAGILFTVFMTTLVDIAMHAMGVFSGWTQPLTEAQAMIATAYRIVISVGGAWLTARLAPQEPMKHALWLGGIGTLLGALGVLMTYGKGLGPDWYPVALALLAVPQCWAGGRLREMQMKRAR